ncbi:hypothetical protein A5906_09270 [Bradyrhizobium sacchari]|nr:hypothetical protein A5906_09270 [Bradyrhizobium sacchari]
MVDFDRRYSHAVLFISYACADLMRADKSALCRCLIVRHSETNIELECLPKMADHVLGPRRSPNLQRSIPPANKPACQPCIRKSDDVIGMKMGKEHTIDSLPSNLDLSHALYCAPASIEKKLLVAGLDQYARTETIHHWWRIPCAQQSYTNFLTSCGGG